MVKTKQDLTGKIFGRLTVIEQAEDYIDSNNKHYAKWLCKCECSKSKVVMQKDLLSGRTQSCGCYNREVLNSKTFSESKRRYNEYKICGNYVTMYTLKGEPFYIDLEDLERVKQFCWHIDRNGYVAGKISKTKVGLLHRLIMNCPDNLFVDHIGGIDTRNDNRKTNLRVANRSQNNTNIRVKGCNTSGVTGVHFDSKKGKWCARINYQGHRLHLGYFKNKEDAIRVRREAESKYYGEWSYNNSQKISGNLKENDIYGNSEKGI